MTHDNVNDSPNEITDVLDGSILTDNKPIIEYTIILYLTLYCLTYQCIIHGTRSSIIADSTFIICKKVNRIQFQSKLIRSTNSIIVT